MNRFKKILYYLPLITALVISFFIYDDFGISWDDPLQRDKGLVSYNYVFNHDKSLDNYFDREFGVAFELPLVFAEKVFKIEDSRSIYLLRHYLTHLFFLLSVFCFFELIRFLFRNYLLAMLGSLFLLLNPVIYGHSFFNSKDIPLMAMFIFCFYLIAKSFSQKKLLLFAISGIACGILVNIRLSGLMLPVLVICFLIIDLIAEKENKSKNLIKILVFISFSIVTLYAFWPYLWSNPIGNFILAISKMSHITWGGNVLYLGKTYLASLLPWHYLPVWLLISNPVLYIVLFFSSLIIFLFSFIKSPTVFFRDSIKRNFLIYLVCALAPVILVITLHSVIYDGWRHFYFIYPALLLLIIFGLDRIFQLFTVFIWIRKLIFVFLILNFSFVLNFMVKNHPVQHVYFNELVSKKNQYIRNHFEQDYWGTSYKLALDKIVEYDHSDTIIILVANPPGWYNMYILKEADRNRIKFVDRFKTAEYFISNYRGHIEDYNFGVPFFEKEANKSKVISAWKLKPDKP